MHNFDPQDKVTFEMSVEIGKLKNDLDDVWLMLHNMTEKKIELENNNNKIIQFYEEEIFALKEKNSELKKAIGAMLTQFGMDEDAENKATFEQARIALT